MTKYYGKQRGVIDLFIEVFKGEIFGYLGPNGAGKTTTIRLLLDFIRPTRGSATILDMDVRQHSVEIRRRLGYLPGELALYDNLTVEEALRFAGELRGNSDWSYVEQLATRLDLTLSQPIRSLSHGNKQKVGLVQALMHKPELLILDEPTTGLDPLVQQEFYEILAEVKAEGRTVLLSSHNLPEVERVCDRVGILREGNLIAVEEVEALKGRALSKVEMRFARPVPPEAFANLAGVEDLRVIDSVVHCRVRGSVDALVKAAAQFETVELISREPSLEDIFLAFYGGEEHAE